MGVLKGRGIWDGAEGGTPPAWGPGDLAPCKIFEISKLEIRDSDAIFKVIITAGQYLMRV